LEELTDMSTCPAQTVSSFTTNVSLGRSVTDWNTLFRIPVLKDGSPGPLGLVAENLRADDFVFGALGAMYIPRIRRILS
jgi:hypothetical protein